MNNPPPQVIIQLSRNWTIRRPYVHRYMDRRFVDDFFERGALRLSSFAQFSKHADEARLDGKEGHAFVENLNKEEEGKFVCSYMITGENSYVFCGSSLWSPNIAQQFSTDSGFRINDTIGFADVVAHRISGFCGGSEGPCQYLPSRIVSRDVGPVGIENFMDDTDPEKMSINKEFDFISQLASDDPLFLKESRYSSQCEYRFVWQTRERVTGFLEIEVPEARQFCTRFEDLYIEPY